MSPFWEEDDVPKVVFSLLYGSFYFQLGFIQITRKTEFLVINSEQ